MCVRACNKTRHKIKVTILDKLHGFCYTEQDIATTPKLSTNRNEQKAKLLKTKISVALQSELGRVPTRKEIDQVFLLSRVMYKAVLGLHFKRQEQKQSGQLAIF